MADQSMLSVVFDGHSRLHTEHQPVPRPKSGEALISVAYTGVCGSDLTLYAGKNPRAKMPVVPGHEFAGRVVGSSGARVTVLPTLSCGHCALCTTGRSHLCESLRFLGVQTAGSMAEYVTAPITNLYPVPDSLADEAAALTEPLAVAVHAVRQAHIEVGDRILVIGAGPIGLMVALTVRLSGCDRVIVTEVAPQRIETAQCFGFETIHVDPKESIGAQAGSLAGYDPAVVFECTGHPSAAVQMIELSRFSGQVVVVGAFKEPAPVDLFRFSRKELTIVGSFAYRPDDFGRALSLLSRDEGLFRPLVTDVVSLDRAQEAIDMMINGDCMKVLVQSKGGSDYRDGSRSVSRH